jgi:hypothetical protein
MSIVYAVPPTSPPAVASPWVGVSMSWRGWDGSTWELTNSDSGVFLMSGGVEGLAMPAHQAWVGQSPAVHGQFYRGHVVEPRQVFWPLFLYSDVSSEEWVARDRAFWRSLHPGKHGMWLATVPGRGERTLSCRFADDGQHAFEMDPVFRGWAKYGVTLIADDPFWRGTPVRRSWAQSTAEGFYGPGNPLFRISSGAQLGTATMTNSGDVEAWPQWTITGPLTSVTVGVDGRTIQWTVELVAGDVLVIDTDPAVQSAWLNGADVTAQLGAVDFAPIPAGEDRTLSLQMTGTGTVEATITPRHYRAW